MSVFSELKFIVILCSRFSGFIVVLLAAFIFENAKCLFSVSAMRPIVHAAIGSWIFAIYSHPIGGVVSLTSDDCEIAFAIWTLVFHMLL